MNNAEPLPSFKSRRQSRSNTAREALPPCAEETPTQNTQNFRKQELAADCADCAELAMEERDSIALERLSHLCRYSLVFPLEVLNELKSSKAGPPSEALLDHAQIEVIVRRLEAKRAITRCERPEHFNHSARCRQCGPIWYEARINLETCPWCINRVNRKPIPRPVTVSCTECELFRPTTHPVLGHCQAGESEGPAGLVVSDLRYCQYFIPDN